MILPCNTTDADVRLLVPVKARHVMTAAIRLPLILVLLVCMSSLGCGDKHDSRDDAVPDKGSQPQPQRTIALKTDDGWTITGDLFTPQDKPIGAAVLLHQRGGSAKDWQALCAQLRLKNIIALAIDQRGSGRSLSPDPKLNDKDAPWDTSDDIAAAVKWLLAQFDIPNHGPNGLNIALVGASYGANNALIYAAAHSDLTQSGSIKSIALFSPGLDYNGLLTDKPAKEWTGPIAIFYATDDQIAGLGPAQIRDTSPSQDKVTRQLDGTGHGTGAVERRRQLTTP